MVDTVHWEAEDRVVVDGIGLVHRQENFRLNPNGQRKPLHGIIITRVTTRIARVAEILQVPVVDIDVLPILEVYSQLDDPSAQV